jgi:glycosyltransferase involved in cell wall biosynthesis
VVKRRHQGADDPSPPERLELEIRLAGWVDAVIATATEEVRELLALGAPAETMHVVPCGVEPELFASRGGSAREGRWRGDGGRILSLGRLVERKGVATLVEALAAVPGAELVVAGGGGPDDPEVRRLIGVAEACGVADRVRLVGPVQRDDVPALIRSADVVACVPWYEPFGIVPLEAMACGRPVVASAVGGMLDTVVDGVTGVHVPPRDPGKLAAALRSLLADRSRRLVLGRAGAQRVADLYTWPRVAADTEHVYRRLSPRSSASAAPARREYR